jgi:alcohol dehydrogenase (cytochrome c)
VVALLHDARCARARTRSGKEVWKSKAAEWNNRYSMTVAPQIANGVLITGVSGAEFGIRGFIDGWDPETGKQRGAGRSDALEP